MSDQLAALAAQYGGAPVGSPAPDVKTSTVPVDARGVPVDAPRDARGQIITSHDEEPGTLDKVNELLGPLAHPQTLTDFARLLTLPVDTVRKAMIGAVTSAAATGAVRSVASAGAKLAVKGAAAVGDVVDPDVIGVVSPRAGKVIQIAQKLRERAAAAQPAAPVPAAAVPPTIGEAADVASDVAPAAPAAAAPPTNALPNQKLLNELAIQARRVGVKLTPEMEQTAIDAVQNGASPQQAVRGFAPLAPTEAPAAWTPTKLRLTAEESKVAAKLIQAGKTDAEVEQAIQAARQFQQRFGTPTPTSAEKRFAKGR